MKRNIYPRQMLIVAVTGLALAIVDLPGAALAKVNLNLTQSDQPIDAELLAQSTPETFQLAQQSAQANCRRVLTGDNALSLNVYSNPGGSITSRLENQDEVTIVNRGANGWVPISAPFSGYVIASYLKLCNQVGNPPTQPPVSSVSCRQVVIGSGAVVLNVRSSANGPVIGTLENGNRVTIVGSTTGSWTQISSPFGGYVFSEYLRPCF
ncbi:MAG: SH3 domain-containing protein [Cyanothece sp. SIO1E1]|nr:SH3 domain-containing protein [Cyanothece sp. SIO1E1]